MRDVIANIRKSHMIEATKAFRSIFGCGLKEAKDAVEAIRDAMPVTNDAADTKPKQYIVARRPDQWGTDYYVDEFDNSAFAMSSALDKVSGNEDVIVAEIIARAEVVTTKTMKAA